MGTRCAAPNTVKEGVERRLLGREDLADSHILLAGVVDEGLHVGHQLVVVLVLGRDPVFERVVVDGGLRVVVKKNNSIVVW